MKNSERLIYLAAITFLAVLSLYAGWRWRTVEAIATARGQSETELLKSQAETVSKTDALRLEAESLKTEVARLRKDLERAEARPSVALPDVYISDLKVRGLTDPVPDLLADLQRHTDLIPFKAIAGGQMRFSPWLINRHWVIAGVDDGHIGGWAILQYEVNNGQVAWTVLSAVRD